MNPCFHKNLGPYDLRFLDDFLNCSSVVSNISMSEKINNFSSLEKCNFNDIIFLNDNLLASESMPAKAILISNKNNSKSIKNKVVMRVDNLHLSIAKLSNLFYSDLTNLDIKKLTKPIINKPIKKISDKSIIVNGCIIGSNFDIGEGSIIKHNCIIGNNVKIGGGSGVIKDIEDNQIVMGYPAVPFKEFIKNWKKK